MAKRMTGIKKQFKRVAFVGPNPYLFLQHLPKDYEIEKFYFCEQAQSSVERSHSIISERVESGFYDQCQVNLPAEIIPLVLDEENWLDHFKPADQLDSEDQMLDLIVSNMSLHWLNNLEGTFVKFRDSL